MRRTEAWEAERVWRRDGVGASGARYIVDVCAPTLKTGLSCGELCLDLQRAGIWGCRVLRMLRVWETRAWRAGRQRGGGGVREWRRRIFWRRETFRERWRRDYFRR